MQEYFKKHNTGRSLNTIPKQGVRIDALRISIPPGNKRGTLRGAELRINNASVKREEEEQVLSEEESTNNIGSMITHLKLSDLLQMPMETERDIFKHYNGNSYYCLHLMLRHHSACLTTSYRKASIPIKERSEKINHRVKGKEGMKKSKR